MISLVDSAIKLLNNLGLNDRTVVVEFALLHLLLSIFVNFKFNVQPNGYYDSSYTVIYYFILLISSPVPPPLPHPHFICMEISMHRGVGGGSQKKGAGMFVISLRGVNFRFWSHLSFSEQNTITFSPKGLF